MERRLRAALAGFVVLALLVPVLAPGLALAQSEGGTETGNSTDAGVGTDAGNGTLNDSQWTYDELAHYGTVKSNAPAEAIRPYGDAGWFAIQHVPVRFLADESDREYVAHDTLVERPQLNVITFRGWDSDRLEGTFHIVLWDFETRETTNAQNETVRERVVTNATHTTVEATFVGGDYGAAQIDLPKHYGEPKLATVWLEGHREDVSWRFRYSVSEASETVPLKTRAGIAGYAAVWMFLPCLGSAVGVIFLDRRVLRKAGNGPMVSVLEVLFALAVATFFALFVWYRGLLEMLATAPWSMGIVGGLVVGVAALFAFSEKAQKVLFFQLVGDDADVRDNGSGRWPVRTREFSVVETDSGRKIRREGWIPWLVAIWPFHDAAPAIDVEEEKLGTRFVGSEDADEYDEVFLCDPREDEPIDYEKGGVTLSFPDVLDWPETEDELVAGRWPIPSVAWGPLIGAFVFVGLAYWLGLQLFNEGFAITFGLLAALATVVKPLAGRAEPNLAPGQYGSLIENLIQHARDFEDAVNREYWKSEALEEKAEKRAERVREREDEDRTTFEKITDELAPPEEGAGETSDGPGVAPSDD